MYTVVVYEDDRVTVAGNIQFNELEDAMNYAKLNMPCEVWFDVDDVFSVVFGFEEEE